MTREQLEHIVRAAAANADTDEIVVVGSQALLGSVPQPSQEVLVRSMEADVFPLKFPERSILIDGAIGEKSIFHESFGYYAHGVAPETAILPEGWQGRLVPVRNENTRGCTGWCLDLHDLAVSKLAAGREKDMEFLGGMRLEGLIDPATLRNRIKATSFPTLEHAEAATARCERLLASEA
ncbi:MAG: hypothetical protein RIQ71_832 [Verrucomicrobiota bacterium]|jgi:hypothetical protein